MSRGITDPTLAQRGAVATEYIFLLALIALVLSAGAFIFGEALDGRFQDAAGEVGTAVSS